MTKRASGEVQDRPPHGPEYLGPAKVTDAINADTAPASTASAARASSPTTACNCAPNRSSRATTPTCRSGTFTACYDEARRLKGDTGANMIALLERRLDTVIYGAKFVPTMFAARQFISPATSCERPTRHVSSFRCKVGDEVEVKEKSRQLALVLEAIRLAERDVPDYIDADHSKMTAKLAPDSGANRRAVSGADGAASRGRILLAVIGGVTCAKHRCIDGASIADRAFLSHGSAPLAYHQAVDVKDPANPLDLPRKRRIDQRPGGAV